MKRARSLPTTAGLGLVAVLALAWPAVAAFSTVAGLFRAGDYSGARDALAAGGQGARPGEELLWQSRLATDPEVALTLLQGAAGDNNLSAAARLRIALETADIHAGRGNHRAVLETLNPVLAEDPQSIPGTVYLRAGLSLRALGRLQQAREMLASVRPGDPPFVLARYYLGDIALDQDDVPLAQRYFAAAAKAAPNGGRSRLAAGTWLAQRIAGADEEAAELVRQVATEDPGSLALLEIRRLKQIADDERRSRATAAAGDSVVARVANTAGRYALQLGAFSDRGLALEFVKQYRGRLPDLRIDKMRDARGQFLYKIRTGDYVNPALARSRAKDLERSLGIDVIAVELAPGADGTSR